MTPIQVELFQTLSSIDVKNLKSEYTAVSVVAIKDCDDLFLHSAHMQPTVQEHGVSPEQLVDLDRRTCAGGLRRVGRLLRGAAVAVQLYLQLPDQVIFGVQLQLQLIDQGIPMSQLLDLQLQSQLEVPQGASALGHGCHARTMRRYAFEEKEQ